MTIQKLQFNPGIDREGTAYDSEGVGLTVI